MSALAIAALGIAATYFSGNIGWLPLAGILILILETD